MPSTVNISGSVSPPEGGSLNYGPISMYNTNNVGAAFPLALSTSELAVAVPSGAIGFGLALPPNNTEAVYMYGVTGESVGEISVHPTLGIPAIGLAVGQTVIYLKAAANVAATGWFF